MITLKRNIGESITIGEDIKITVSNIFNNEVKICIEAPDNLSIYRTEMRDNLIKDRIERSTR